MSAEIKFCGLTRPQDAELAVELGASYVGVIFAGGPRMLTIERAIEVLDRVPERVSRVGVFAEQTADEIGRVADRLGLDVVQLHSTSDAARIDALRRGTGAKVWSVCRVTGSLLPPGLD